MRYLCIGGPRHGEFIIVYDERRTFIVPIMSPISVQYSSFESSLSDVSIRTAEYERRAISDRVVYVCVREDRR